MSSLKMPPRTTLENFYHITNSSVKITCLVLKFGNKAFVLRGSVSLPGGGASFFGEVNVKCTQCHHQG